MAISPLLFLVGNAESGETYASMVARLVAQAGAQDLERPGIEADLLKLVNNYRATKGLPRLAYDESAHAAALAHAMDMLQHNFMGHRSSLGHEFEGRMRALRGKVMVLPSLGENAARVRHSDLADAALAQALFEQWVKSPPHRQTMVSRDYFKLATGVVSRGGDTYADQIFIGPDVKTNMTRAAPEGTVTLY